MVSTLLLDSQHLEKTVDRMEKVKNEATILQNLYQNTDVPVPRVLR